MPNPPDSQLDCSDMEEAMAFELLEDLQERHDALLHCHHLLITYSSPYPGVTNMSTSALIINAPNEYGDDKEYLVTYNSEGKYFNFYSLEDHTTIQVDGGDIFDILEMAGVMDLEPQREYIRKHS